MTSGVIGAKEVAARLRAIGAAPTAAVRRRARAAALQPIMSSAADNLRANGSVVTGRLLRGLVIQDVRANETRFGQRGKHEPVAHLVEWGTAPHWQPNYRGGWMHPGARPYPFVRPALDAHRQEAVKIYADHIWRAVAAAARS